MARFAQCSWRTICAIDVKPQIFRETQVGQANERIYDSTVGRTCRGNNEAGTTSSIAILLDGSGHGVDREPKIRVAWQNSHVGGRKIRPRRAHAVSRRESDRIGTRLRGPTPDVRQSKPMMLASDPPLTSTPSVPSGMPSNEREPVDHSKLHCRCPRAACPR